LLVNALKYARAKGPIVISIDAGVDRNGDLSVTVPDNGDPEWPRTKHALPGIGTGLVIQLVRRVSGNIEYEPLVRGRRIRISVPLSAFSPLHASGIAG
jgi:two-component sensor histidine kinase